MKRLDLSLKRFIVDFIFKYTSIFLILTIYAQSSEAQISKRLVRVGLTSDAYPISYRNSVDNWEGYCVSFFTYFRDINEEIEIEYTQVDDRFQGKDVKEKPIDVECGPNTITSERKIKLQSTGANFSFPFILTGAKILIKNSKIHDFYDLKNVNEFKIGAPGIKGETTTQNLLKWMFPNNYASNKINTVARPDVVDQLRANSLDLYVNDELLISGILKLENIKNYSLMPKLGLLSHENYGMVTYEHKTKNSEIYEKINSIINKKDHYFKRIGNSKVLIVNDKKFKDSFKKSFPHDHIFLDLTEKVKFHAIFISPVWVIFFLTLFAFLLLCLAYMCKSKYNLTRKAKYNNKLKSILVLSFASDLPTPKTNATEVLEPLSENLSLPYPWEKVDEEAVQEVCKKVLLITKDPEKTEKVKFQEISSFLDALDGVLSPTAQIFESIRKIINLKNRL